MATPKLEPNLMSNVMTRNNAMDSKEIIYPVFGFSMTDIF